MKQVLLALALCFGLAATAEAQVYYQPAAQPLVAVQPMPVYPIYTVRTPWYLGKWFGRGPRWSYVQPIILEQPAQ
jgi:hypothetical protein